MGFGKGQAFSEYLLALALIAVVLIGGMSLIGSNIAQGHTKNASEVANAKELYGLLDANGGQGLAPNTNTNGNGAPIPNETTAAAEVSSQGTVNITTSSGLTINLDTYPTDLQQSVETAGANGTTKLLLANLDTMIHELQQNNELTTEEANLFEALSNQGHRLARMEAVIEQAVEDATTDGITLGEMHQRTVAFEGQIYTVEELGSALSYQSSLELQAMDIQMNTEFLAKNPFTPLRHKAAGGDELNHFIDLYEKLASTGAMNDPAIGGTVKQLSGEVVTLAESLEHSLGMKYNVVSNSPASTAQHTLVSETTHYNSGGICNIGGGQDTGIHCP